MVNDHIVPCWRHDACAALAKAAMPKALTCARHAPGFGCSSGKRLDLLNPTPFDWEDEDLALGLARTYRWGGHSAWPLPLSVAQHSLFVLQLRRLRFPDAKDAARRSARIAARCRRGPARLRFYLAAEAVPWRGLSRARRASANRHLRALWPAGLDGEGKAPSQGSRSHRRRDRSGARRRLDRGRNAPRPAHPLRSAERRPACQRSMAATPSEPWPPQLAAERFLAELLLLIAQSAGSKKATPLSEP